MGEESDVKGSGSYSPLPYGSVPPTASGCTRVVQGYWPSSLHTSCCCSPSAWAKSAVMRAARLKRTLALSETANESSPPPPPPPVPPPPEPPPEPPPPGPGQAHEHSAHHTSASRSAISL